MEDIVDVNQEVLELVPAGSSLANLYAGEYTVKQIMEAMLVPSGNDAAYALAYHIAKNELGEGYTATEYIDSVSYTHLPVRTFFKSVLRRTGFRVPSNSLRCQTDGILQIHESS